MVWLLRLVLLFLIVFIIYKAVHFFMTPERKLNNARKHKRFFLLDHDEAIKNLHLTYHGAVFTGEKYLGATNNSIVVVSITLWPECTTSLKELKKDDFYYIEKRILEKYPAAKIHWKSPIQEFLKK